MTELTHSDGAAGRDWKERAPAVEAEEVSFAYRQPGFALQRVSLRIEAGEVALLLGPSGSGKSTFLKLVKGILRPQSGTLRVLGHGLSRAGARELRRACGSQIAYIPQQLGLVRTLTARENVLTGALARTSLLAAMLKVFPPPVVREADALLAQLGIAHKVEEKVYRLSGGERQRVAIARALMQRPRLVLADEFVSQLDPVTTREIMAQATRAAKQGITFLITTHEIELAAAYGDRAIFFREGRAIHQASAHEVTIELVNSLMKKE